MKKLIMTGLGVLYFAIAGCAGIENRTKDADNRDLLYKIRVMHTEEFGAQVNEVRDHPDVRRTVRVKPATGKQIVSALKHLVKKYNLTEDYLIQEQVCDNDGTKSYRIGVIQPWPAGDIIVRTGEHLEDTTVILEKTYGEFGIGSTYWTRPGYGKLDPGCCGGDSFIECFTGQVTRAIEGVRDDLEGILREEL